MFGTKIILFLIGTISEFFAISLRILKSTFRHKKFISPETQESYFKKVIRQIGEGKRSFADYGTNGPAINDMAMGVSLFTQNHVSVELMNDYAAVCTSKLLNIANEQIEIFITWWKGKNLLFIHFARQFEVGRISGLINFLKSGS